MKPRLLLLCVLCLNGCGKAPSASSPGTEQPTLQVSVPVSVPLSAPLFKEAALAAGLDFVHQNGRIGTFHIAELMGAGAALADFDKDGDLDLYLVQGGSLEGSRSGGFGDHLFRNDTSPGGALRYTDITAESRLAAYGYGMGVATGDVDGDGRVDLYVTNRGPNRLLRNRGSGDHGGILFEDISVVAGVDCEEWNVAATFFDFDRDGWLDLFVGGYLDDRQASPQRCTGPSGRRDYCGASHFPGVQDRLFRNLGVDGSGQVSFEDITVSAGLERSEPGRALGVLAADLDGDGWLDLYVGNDAGTNRLWINQGDGTLIDQGPLSGTAVNGRGETEASMGVDAADYDGDGDLDLFMTHLVVETNTLYRNRGGGLFEDRTAGSALGPPSRIHTSFGTHFADFDGDGWLDLFVANGAVQQIDRLVHLGDPFPVHETNQLFRNLGGDDGEVRFMDITARAGEAFTLSEVSRGVALGDLDNDGDIDIVVSNNGGAVRLLANQSESRRWIGLRVVTGEPPRDALGAEVVLRLVGQTPRRRRVASDGSYASASDPRVVFHLASGETAEGVEVRWPDGSVEAWEVSWVGEYGVLRQGMGGSTSAER